jgi:type IV pilus assembly protein PilE
VTTPEIRTRAQGFTLIELMIALGVVGILAAIAYPSYREQIRKSHRSEAQSILLQNAQFLERNFTANNCYHRTDGDCGAEASIELPWTKVVDSGGAARYTVQFGDGEPTRNSFILEAVPTGAMSEDDCGTFTLNHMGTKSIKDKPEKSTKTVEQCWQR